MARSGRGRLPKGWKILGDDVYCPTCKTQLFAIRAVVIPIAGPVDHSWEELRTALHEVWSSSTACANWMTTELYARDVRRQPGDVKLGRMPRTYLYPEARAIFPALPPQSLPALELELQRQYRAHRHELLWTRSRALSSHRYPYPLPIPSRSWCVTETGGAWHLSFRLGDARWTVRLRGGPGIGARLEHMPTTSACPSAAAHVSAVVFWNASAALTSTPRVSNWRTAGTLPDRAAASSGVSPSGCARAGSAPARSSSSIIAASPMRLA